MNNNYLNKKTGKNAGFVISERGTGQQHHQKDIDVALFFPWRITSTR
ncbi:MAG: hypothetical protein GW775_00450 [Candidatus Magasanikbacteria bacterium]|nr:hypothetical protein [Candidatus Magasanikbacteria bacterium]